MHHYKQSGSPVNSVMIRRRALNPPVKWEGDAFGVSSTQGVAVLRWGSGNLRYISAGDVKTWEQLPLARCNQRQFPMSNCSSTNDSVGYFLLVPVLEFSSISMLGFMSTMWEKPDTIPAVASTRYVIGMVQLNLRWHLCLHQTTN